MPVVYRLGDLFVLPSAFGETWGLGVNEALACGRPVLVSTQVGCAADVVNRAIGRIFTADNWGEFGRALDDLVSDPARLHAMRAAAQARAWDFDIPVTEASTMHCLIQTLGLANPVPAP